MSIDNILKQFKNDLERNEFIEAQQKVINDLSLKNKKLEEENKQLLSLVEKTVPIISDKPVRPSLDLGTDEEEIAKMEIYKLKQKSMNEKELTLEEAKRLEIYTKIINSKIKNDIVITTEAKKFNDPELLKLAEGSIADEN